MMSHPKAGSRGSRVSDPTQVIARSFAGVDWDDLPEPSQIGCTAAAESALEALRDAGWRLYRPDDHIIGQIDSVRFDTPGQDIVHLRVPSQMWDSAAMKHRYALVPTEPNTW